VNDDVYTYTVCGLLVDQDPPGAWSGGTWGVKALDADGAVGFVRNDVTGQASDDGRLVVADLALACVHLGDVDRVGRIEAAWEDVTVGDLDRHDGGELLLFTVCGVDRWTWETLCYQVDAPHWLNAYVAARDVAAADGFDLLHAATHPGWVERLEGFPFADFLAKDPAAMRLRVEEWGVR
jgi:hypothetical protein